MTVGELKEILSLYKDDVNIVLNCEDINGTEVLGDIDFQTNDGNENSPLFLEFQLKEPVSVIKSNIKQTPYVNKYFEEIGYKYSYSSETVYDVWNEYRTNDWLKQQSECGNWDERVTWNLDTFISEQLYTWLQMYLEFATCYADIDTIQITISSDNIDLNDTKSLRAWVELAVDYLKKYLLNKDGLSEELEKFAETCQKNALLILSEITPYLWW